MESSLKLKEVSYLHSEAMPAGELKHGSLALITEGTPVLAINTQSHTYDKTNSAVQEVKARGAMTVGVGFDDRSELARLVDHFVGLPRVDDRLAPAVVAVPLQLLAYHVARKLGHEIDQPRNLAKSVTVE
jgi:glucosamine--fructose-6-phosphate aminotransferase (isomerizing)